MCSESDTNFNTLYKTTGSGYKTGGDGLRTMADFHSSIKLSLHSETELSRSSRLYSIELYTWSGWPSAPGYRHVEDVRDIVRWSIAVKHTDNLHTLHRPRRHKSNCCKWKLACLMFDWAFDINF